MSSTHEVETVASVLSPGRRKLLALKIENTAKHGGYLALNEWRLDLRSELKLLESRMAEEKANGDDGALPNHQLHPEEAQQLADHRARRTASIEKRRAVLQFQLDAVTEATNRQSAALESTKAIVSRLETHLQATDPLPVEYQ